MSQTVDFTEDTFDIRDVIDRFEALDSRARGDGEDTQPASDEDSAEYAMLKDFLEEMQGCGGDEQWQGNWYPVTFIRDSYFTDYARDLADDLHGAAMRDAQWPFDCIDWDEAARQLKHDYSECEIDGTTYLYR